jgi:hypothetical protein
MKKKQYGSQFLTPEEVAEFKLLVLQEKGIRLSSDEALDQGSRLIMLFEALQKFEPVQLFWKDIVENTAKSDKIRKEK